MINCTHHQWFWLLDRPTRPEAKETAVCENLPDLGGDQLVFILEEGGKSYLGVK